MEKIAGTKPLFRDKKRRVWEIDFLRGFAVLAMCFDHFMYDCSHPRDFFSNFSEVTNAFAEKLYTFASWYWKSSNDYVTGFRFWGHAVFIFLFLFLVGTSCAFSRDNAKRGAQIGVAAFVFTGITFVLKVMGIMTYGVVFGILHCIALSVLICAAVDSLTKFNKYVNKYAPLVIGVVILAFGIYFKSWEQLLYDGSGHRLFDYEFVDEHFLGYIFGTHAFGDDWFGLFPYLGFVFLGIYWGRAAYPTRQSLLPRLNGKWNKPFTFVGRHALLTYFIHQVVIAGLIMLVGLCLGYSLTI
ncbi:MAG: DUF1624 domain-containing protein [Clostridiales bacterium]|nr:DUF1624 domain-containing protein [Clostridiales bacterium]